MKKLFYMAVAAIAALSSCSGDDAILNEDGQNVTGVTTFTATIEDEGETRTTYNATTHKAEWVEGEAISVDGNNYTAASTGASTTFSGSGATGTTHHAYFPASLYNSGTPTLPATQTYTAGEFNMPMYAESTTTEFTFKNLCAVLAVKVASGTVKKIKVVADKRLHGAFTATAAGVLTFTATGTPTDAERTVTLDCGSGVTANNTTFYIAIPAQTYSYLNIYLSADGTTYKEAMATKKAAGLGAIARSKMYNIDYAKNAVQLWSDGPYFAEENVVSSYDDYYVQWQAGMDAWGANWTIPSEDQMKALFNTTSNTTFAWTINPNGSDYGFKFTGKESGYMSVSLFLPAMSGGADDGFACYWSGTPGGETKARYVYLDGDADGGYSYLDSHWNSFIRTFRYFVRLVLRN